MKYLFKHHLSSVLSSIALAVCLTTGIATVGAQTYDLTDLGVLPGKESEAANPAAINDQGQVAGNSGESAFRSSGTSQGSLENLARNVPQSVTRAFGINAAGQVVGDAIFEQGAVTRKKQPPRHAVIFKEGSLVDLGVLKSGGAFSRANSINLATQVVGFSGPTLDGTSSRAFIWSSRTGMVDLGTLGGAYAQAWGINDSGYVTGNSQTAAKFSNHAFLWHAKTGMIDLGTLAGDFSYGTFLNAKNHVAGYSTVDKENERVHAFLFNGSKMQDLGSLSPGAPASDLSYGLGVNDNDEVVGYAFLPASGPIVGDGPTYAPRQVAFLYRDGAMIDLNTLIGSTAERYRIHSATAINNKGQIAAVAFDTKANAFRAVLLTPAEHIDGLVSSIKITNATYWKQNQGLVVEAVSATKPVKEVLDVMVPTGKKIGSLDSNGDGTYSGKFFFPTNPQEIVVASSLGGSVRATVKEVGNALTTSGR